MKETGRVVSVGDRICEVEFSRSSACESCGACNRFGDNSMRVTLDNTLDADTGDTVVVEMGAKNVIGATVWAYIFPLCLLVAGAFVGKWLMDVFSLKTDWIVAASALVFAAMAYIILKLLNPYFENKRGFRPAMVEIYRSEKRSKTKEEQHAERIGKNTDGSEF